MNNTNGVAVINQPEPKKAINHDGGAAFLAGETFALCPHEEGTEECRRWHREWLHTCIEAIIG